ncbi:hypothetical protein MM221_20925 [Salipaludibacillus sp. LMS25]|uniref:hypothetical protein n=1 Tax=Salipaludibacillus sp. LMS25 TaxID=2924031 RepID=UPI0020D0FFE4|nr:hypothetical protein [Salipaludibacillus sp. LMS25]UTR14964.1 hypothetical protein MM221_20925 [Salipaludibacillus sp. LMS25]
MQLKPSFKRNNLPQHYLVFLSFIETYNIKIIVASFTLLLVDLGVLYLITVPLPLAFYYVLLVPVVGMNLWMLRILFKNPYTVQYESIWFVGLISLLGVIIYLCLLQFTAFFHLNISSPVYFIVSNIIYISSIFVFMFYQINKYADPTKKKKSHYIYYSSWLTTGPGIGYIIGQSLTRQSEFLMWSVLFICFVGFFLFLSHVAVKFIYKALFMKANWHLVVFQKPLKRDRKKFREKGLVLK